MATGVCLSPFYCHENFQKIYSAIFGLVYGFTNSLGCNRNLDDNKRICSDCVV